MRPSTSSKSNSVLLEKRIGLILATTNGRRYGLVKPFFLSLSTIAATEIVDLEDEPGASRPFLQRLRQPLVEKVVDPAQHRVVGASAQPRPLLVGGAECQERRLLELELEIALAAGLVMLVIRERAEHADRFERLLFEVVRLLGIEGENLERDVGFGDDERDHRSGAELPHRLQPVIPVRSPIAVTVAHGDDWIEEPAELLDDVHQPLDVRLRGVALIRRRLDESIGKVASTAGVPPNGSR